MKMNKMKEISFDDREAIKERLEELASRGNMSKEERAQYDYEWKIYNDYLNTLSPAWLPKKSRNFKDSIWKRNGCKPS